MANPSFGTGFAILFLILGLFLTIFGADRVGFLSRSYQIEDAFRSENPVHFSSWLQNQIADDPESGDEAIRSVGDRLLLMTMPARRNLVLIAMRNEFWHRPEITEKKRNTLIEHLLNGTLDALRQAPTQSDLWLLAAKLHTRLFGFDANAAKYLSESQLFGPNESDLAAERVAFATVVWPLMEQDTRELLLRDLRVLEISFPKKIETIKDELSRLGIKVG